MKTIKAETYDEKYFLKKCRGASHFQKSRGRFLNKRYLKALQIADIKNNQKILDVGCGRGEVSLAAAKRAKLVVGIDYSAAGIKIARKNLENFPEVAGKCTFEEMNAKKMKFADQSFNIILMLDVAEHLYPNELEQVLAEANRVLKKNGRLILHTAPNIWVHKYGFPLFKFFGGGSAKKAALYHHFQHVNLQSTQKLKKSLSKNFKKFSVWLESPEPSEAPFKTGRPEKKATKYFYFLLRKTYPFKLIFCNDIFAVAIKLESP